MVIPPLLYSDDRLLVFNKPSGLLSVPGIGPEKADCLIARVQKKYPEARTVHRLDRDTSGVIVMGLDKESHRELSRQFQDRETKKTYHALVEGHLAHDSGEIDLPLRKDLENTPLHIVDHECGKPSQTMYTVTSRGTLGDLEETLAVPTEDASMPISRLELMPRTGRSHQLRVHLLSLGHSILGDDLYAPPASRAATKRLCLHATRLGLVHPETAAPLVFVCPPPF